MNPHDEIFSADDRDRLEQELLELHFGCHPDAEALQARLAAEPALRALQAQVLRQANVLERAVRDEVPQLQLRVPTSGGRSARWRWLSSPRWRLLAAAAVLGVVALGSWGVELGQAARLTNYQANHLHVTISAPQAVPTGAPWQFTVQAADLRGTPADCRLRWRAFDAGGNPLGADEVALQHGSATVSMAASLQAVKRVEVLAVGANDEVRQVFELSAAMAGPLVHVSTDRPLYRPGETVLVRTVRLDRVTRLPEPGQFTPVLAELLDSKGAVVARGYDASSGQMHGVAAATLQIPADSRGGVHRVRVTSRADSFAPEFADVVVRPFEAPQLQKTIVLDRISYAPGARGTAAVRATRLATGGAATGAMAKAALVIDGDEVWSERRSLGSAGAATFAFVVPGRVDKGSARFVATIEDGGIVETEVRPFVVPTGKLLVGMFPEGGELIAGVENGLYLECTDPLGRSIDTFGELIDGRGERLTKFKTTHQGRVRLGFVPQAGQRYHVRLAGDDEQFELPPVREQGIALRTSGDDVAAGAALPITLAGRGNGPWLVGVFCRGVLVGQTTLRPDDQGELRADVQVPLAATASGVLRVTVFDREQRPVAERLVRRLDLRRVDVRLTPSHAVLAPGATQQLAVHTTDENGQPIAAVCGLSVTDLAVASLGSEPRLGLADAAMLFADVERVENLGDFFLGNEHSAQHVDLLLGTRGWRRFVWRNDDAAKAAIAAHGDFGAGVLAREGFSQTPKVTSNLQAASAPAATLAQAARRAENVRQAALVLGALLLLVLTLGELLTWLLRRAAVRPHLGLWIAGLGSAALLVGLVLAAFTNRLGAPLAVEAEAPLLDFVMDQDAGTSDDTLRRWREPKFDQLERGLLLYDDFDRRTLTMVRAASGDPATNPLAGFFYDDSSEADVRGRTENLFVPRLPPESRFARGWVDLPPAQRQYAHRHTATDDRRDFAPTIYWHTLLLTDASGAATATFDTSDAVTTWLVQADAHVASGIGRIGQGSTTFTTQLPFHVETKLPDELAAGDRLLLPVHVTSTDPTLASALLSVRLGPGLHLATDAPTSIPLADGRGRVLLPITVDAVFGTSSISLETRAGGFVDRLTRPLTIAPRGFPHRDSSGGTVRAGSPATWTLTIPAASVPDTGHVRLKVFPSPLTSLTEGLAGIVQEPHGCFEQASSANYPNTLVLTLLDATGDVVPEVAARARALLPKGYAKIAGYECRQRGYEWFGADPGHEALTAYGLLEFHDMAKVYAVDAEMVTRTRDWLLARRDGKGNFVHQGADYHSFGGRSQPLTNAYATYALLQSGTTAAALQVELEALRQRTPGLTDPYELALIACAFDLANHPEAPALRRQLADLQRPDGSLHGTTTSITSSGGQDLVVETTGFAVHAWLGDPAFAANVRLATEAVQRCRAANGTFGSTQATIVALRALTAYALANRSMRQAGTLRVFVGERVLAERTFAADETQAIEFDLWSALPPGEHTLRLELDGGGAALPFACDVAYFAEQPANAAAATLAVATSLRAATVREGETVALDVTVTNTATGPAPTPLAIVGLPAGLEVATRVLDDLQRGGAFAAWEQRGRELVFYWRELGAGATQRFVLDLTARVPGTSSGPASRAFRYYDAAAKHWAAPLLIEVTAAP